MHRDRPEPLLFAAWLRALAHTLFADEFGPAFEVRAPGRAPSNAR